ncbi:MAG TPA: right-handed parallel beta-helix repeat-containing protein, partial [Flavobacteriales bacterium]|nr:right-handed parallel beta-helix repeat-containing protein [Flavobacteriales bacterium]
AVNMRASDMLVRNCTFADLPFTALRVARSGEATVQGGRFSGNKVAIAALDGSAVQVKGCEFSGNGTVFVLRRERPVLGGATLKEEGNTFTGNAVLKEVDAASKLGQDGTGGAAQ